MPIKVSDVQAILIAKWIRAASKFVTLIIISTHLIC